MLLGRDRELRAIAEVLDRARNGSSAVVAFVGEAGIGKSSLLDWTVEQAEGMNVLRARGVQSEAHIPFAGLFELLRPALDALDRLPQPQAAALESALALRPSQAQARFAVGAATLSLLAAHAESGPLVLLVDDAHWLDGSSADALRFAFRRLVADPIAVVITARQDEPSLLDGTDISLLTVAGLDLDAAAELLRRRVPQTTADRAARLHRETGGNPLALLELAEEPMEEIPLEAPLAAVSNVAAAYLQRMRALPERTRAALVLLAASDAGDLTVVARAAAQSGLDVADLVPAEERDLVHMDGRGFEFRHPLMRSAIYGDASPEARRAAHRALADALPDKEADRRAWHLALAATGPDAAASSALEQAGMRAHARSAYAVAAPAFERAAGLAPEESRAAGLLYAAADAAWLAGNAAHAVGLLDRAAAANDGDLRLGIRIDHLRGQIAARRGPVDEARRILSAAAEHAAVIDPEQAVVMLVGATNASFYAGDAGAMVESAQRAAELARRVGGSAELLARLAQGMALVFAGEGEPGAPLIRDAVVELEASAELRDDPYLVVWAALGPLWLREAEVGRSLYERALALVRSRTALGALPELLVHLARDWATTDQWAAAHAAYDEGIALARESGQGIALAFGLCGLAWLDARQGRDEDCRRRAAEGADVCAELGAAVHGLWTLAALADLETGRGRPDEALPHLEAWAEQLRARGIADVDLSPGPELVETYLRLGRTQEAAAAAEGHDAAARAKGQPWALARAARCRGLLASDDDVEEAFEEALRLHAQTPDVFEAARTELAYGSRLRRAGQRVRARERLRVAIRIFDDLGAEPWSDLARAELAATGETARKRDVSTLDQLTPQELQIALLLAGGRTTREAAAAMFLSPKTIEYHLRNAYRKLGVNSRAALAEALERQNAAAPSLG